MKTFHSSRSLLIKYLGMRQLVVLLVLLATASHKPRNSTALVCVLVHSTHYCFTTGHPTPICMEVLTLVEYIVISCRPNIAFIKGFPMIIRIQVALKIGSTVAWPLRRGDAPQALILSINVVSSSLLWCKRQPSYWVAIDAGKPEEGVPTLLHQGWPAWYCLSCWYW